MDVSPKTLREVEFREKKHGYHQDDVDLFLEQVAVGLEVLHDRLRQAVDRAQRAEAAASDAAASAPDTSGSDETLRRTLVLAQRTADLAVSEAREQAARLLAGAEQQAQAMLADAEDRARRSHEESLAEMRADLARLEAKRQQAQGEVDLIRRWVDEQRNHLTGSLRDALRMLERSGTTSAPPASHPIDLPPSRPLEPSRPVEPNALDLPPASAPPSLLGGGPESGKGEEAHHPGPETVAWPPPAGRGDQGYQGQEARGPDPAPAADPRPTDPPARREAAPRTASAPRRDVRPESRARPEPRPRPGSGRAPARGEGAPRTEPPAPAAVVRAETADPAARDPKPEAEGARRPDSPTGESPAAEDGPDEQALDDFFDDEQFAEERRFGRLRRRR